LRMKRSLLVQSSFTFLNPLQPSGTTLSCEGGSLGTIGLTVVTGFFLQPRFRLLQHHLFFFLLHSSLVMQLNRGLGLVVDVVVGVVVGMVVTGFFLQPRFRLLQHHLFFFLLHSSLVMQLNRGLGLVVDVVVGVVVGMVVTGSVTFNGAGVVTGFKGGKTGGKTGTMGGVVVLG